MSHPLATKTAMLRRRWSWQRWATGALRTAAAAIALATALALLDYLLRFQDVGIRLIASAIFIGCTLFVAYGYWMRPAWRPLDEFDVARRLEQRFPQLGDRLASSLDFLQKSEDDATAGSPMLRRLVIAETAQAVEALPVDEAEDTRPLRRAAWFTAVALGIAGLLAIINPALLIIGLGRLVLPLSRIEWPRQHHLSFVSPPAQLATGHDFEVELIDSNGRLPEDATIHYRWSQNGRDVVESAPMLPVGEVMLARRENVRRSFQYRATGGDDDAMPWQAVEVVDPPGLKSFAVTAHPPVYTCLPSHSVDQHFRVLEGTRLEVAGEATGDVRATRITFADGEPVNAKISPESQPGTPHAFRVSDDDWIANQTTQYWLELESAGGIVGRHGPWNIRVDPDMPPRITWRKPEIDLFVTSGAVVPLEVLAADDLAVERIELVFTRSDAPAAASEHLTLLQGPTHAANGAIAEQSATYEWNLTPFKLPIGSQLIVHATATDYRPSTGQSSPRRITIISADALDARLAGQQEQILRYLEEAARRQRAARAQVESVIIQHRETGTVMPADEDNLQSAELNQRRVEEPLSQGAQPVITRLIQDITNNRVQRSDLVEQLNELQSVLTQLADGPLATSDEALSSARKAVDLLGRDENDASERGSIAEQLSQQLSTAAHAQDETLRELEKWLGTISEQADFGRLARDIAQLRKDQIDLRKRTQEEIGLANATRSLDELDAKQRADLLKAAEAQAGLSQRLEQLQAAIGQQAAEASADKPSLSAARDQLRSRGTGAKMRDATDDLGRNRVASALDRQQQVADDLEKLLDTLRNRESSNQMAQQSAEERRQSAIDAALNQLEQLEHAIRALAEQQERLLRNTQTVNDSVGNATKLTENQSGAIRRLGEQQHTLELETRVAAETLEGIGVFRLAIGEAAQQMDNAVSGFRKLDTGHPVQEAQLDALRRLNQIAEAFHREAQAQADANRPDAADGQNPPDKGDNAPPPLFELAEIKLLRELQTEINARTRLLERQLAAENSDAEERAALQWQAKLVAAEQRRLAELVAEILSRDNKEDAADESHE